jgi:hypothetical protein
VVGPWVEPNRVMQIHMPRVLTSQRRRKMRICRFSMCLVYI